MSTIQEYLDTLAQTAGLEDEVKSALKKALGNEKFAKELESGVKRHSDYSRAMDEVRAQTTKLETEKKSYLEWYDNALKVDAAREEELQQYRAGKGGTTTVTPTTVVNPGFSKKEIEDREGNLIQIVKQGMRLASRHAAKFGEELDTDALEKLAVEKGLNLERAYDEYVRPRVEEARQKEFDEKVKLAREEGIREGLSKRDLPGEGEKAAFHPIFGYSKAVEATKGLTGQQRVSSFEEAWNSATAKK
jgi:hypothetical protein